MKKKYKNYYGHPKFYEKLDRMAELHSRKNYQYATKDDPLGNFHRCGNMVSKLLNPNIKNKALATALIYMSKQVDGAMEIVGEGKKGTVDSLIDKLQDISVYAVIAQILSEEDE